MIPFAREPQNNKFPIWRHLGVYLFQREFLIKFQKWPQTILEQTEKLEQLRILENGETLLCVEAINNSFSVDVPDDIEYIEKKLKNYSI